MKKSKTWIKCAGIRAIKTVAQTAIATIGTAAVLAQVDWRMVLSASILAGILSILTSLAGLPEVGDQNGDTENAADAEQVQQTADTAEKGN